MDTFRMESPDLVQKNIDKIATLFPNCITETIGDDGKLKKAINFGLLQQMLSSEVAEGDEAFEFTWVGKKAAIVEANKPIRKTLRPCPEESKCWDNTGNLYIEGDNLDVLKLLQESYLGKIKMIYIDPPYNTGNDFIYKDNFTQARVEYDDQLGIFDEESGDKLFKNTDSNGRFHSDWCSMMYSRLQIARDLLTDDGLIFISIDDTEQANLRNICDEIFGASNFISVIVWEKRYTRSNNAKLFASLTDYILLYRKSSTLSILRESRTEKNDSIYSNPDNDPRGVWTSVSYVNPASKEQRPNLCYEIINPITGERVNHPTNAWKYEYATHVKHVKENRLYWGKNGENKYPRLKKFLTEMEGGIVPANLWYHKDVGTTDIASKDLEKLIGRGIFDFPKSTQLIEKMLDIASDKNSIILDFFSGSSTTAHSVMNLNAKDNGQRKFIMVQLPESCDEKSEAYKAGYKNICEIGKERIRRAGDKIYSKFANQQSAISNQQSAISNQQSAISNQQDLDIGFRVFKLADSNMTDVFYSAEDYNQDMLSRLESNVKPDRTDLDLLFGCLLEWGLPLSLPYHSEQIEGYTVHTYNDGDLIACFAPGVPESVIREIAKRQPLRAVFRDNTFSDSPSKINVGEIFKMLAPDTRIKVI